MCEYIPAAVLFCSLSRPHRQELEAEASALTLQHCVVILCCGARLKCELCVLQIFCPKRFAASLLQEVCGLHLGVCISSTRRCAHLCRACVCSPGDKKEKGAIDISGAQLFEDGEKGSTLDDKEFVFTIKCGRKSYHIHAANDAEKRGWLSALSYNMAQTNLASPNRLSLLRCVRYPRYTDFVCEKGCPHTCALCRCSRSIALSSPSSGLQSPLGTAAPSSIPFPRSVASGADRISVFCGTWNMAEQSAPDNIRDWIPPDRDIYAIGLQECMEAKLLRSMWRGLLGCFSLRVLSWLGVHALLACIAQFAFVSFLGLASLKFIIASAKQ